MMKKLMMMTVVAILAMGGSAFAALEEMNLLYDTYIDEASSDAFFGSLNVLRIRSEGFDYDDVPSTYEYKRYILLQFDLSDIPEGVELTDGIFGIFGSAKSDSDAPSIQLWVLNSNAWDGTLTWDESLALLDDKDAIGTPEQLDFVPQEMKWEWNALNVWNYSEALATDKKVSFLLTIDTEFQDDISLFAEFFSNENAELKPYLKLEYAIPEPATLSLLAMGMGGIAAFRKKR